MLSQLHEIWRKKLDTNLNVGWPTLRQPKKAGLRKRRSTSIEVLETRRLLVAEGEVFSVTRNFDSTGLVGGLVSTVTWGDGTQSAGQVSGALDNNGPLRIRFEYVGSFFNDGARRAALQAVADSIVERFSDDLTAITPGGILQWTATTTNPATGAELRIPNLSVAANEIVIYVGAQDLPANQAGIAGPGGFSFPGGSFTQEQINQIDAFRENARYRGETAANQTNPTDFSTWGGFISFDSNTDWHFGTSDVGLEPHEVDFQSVALHELMHVLGFGIRYSSRNSSFETYSNGSVFTGPKARALYGGNVPLEGQIHLSREIESRGQTPVISPEIPRGRRITITPLDLATLDDLGWTIRPAPQITVTASHTYADNPVGGTVYPVSVELRGTSIGSITQQLDATVTNTAPILEVPENQEILVGDTLSLTNIGQITDKGFVNNAGQTAETFDYSIVWGDGTEADTGTATIDRHGTADPNVDTLASFDGSHTFDRIGNFTVRVAATDDDGGTTAQTFSVNVQPLPLLQLQVSQNAVIENEGSDVLTLSITRTGALDTQLSVNLLSDDTNEITVSASAVFQPDERVISVPLAIVDDDILDGLKNVTITADAARYEGGSADVDVRDHETIDAAFSSPSVLENDSTSVSLRVSRSNTNVDEELSVPVRQISPVAALGLPNPIVIPAGQQSVELTLAPTDNDTGQPTQILTYEFSAAGYTGSPIARINLVDDEPPSFQNVGDVYNVNGIDGVTPFDALSIINFLSEFGAEVELNPNGSYEHFYDVDGNYFVTPFDALAVINELSDLARAEGLAGEAQPGIAPVASGIQTEADDDETLSIRDQLFANAILI